MTEQTKTVIDGNAREFDGGKHPAGLLSTYAYGSGSSGYAQLSGHSTERCPSDADAAEPKPESSHTPI
ncbi:UNVERIFIED_ORG: hypothetical protein ABIC54_001621 [Burkholderia sp. 1263]